MLLPFLRTYAFLLLAVVVSAAGLAMLLRGLRIAGRRRREQCVQCGYVLTVPTASPVPSDRPLSNVCTECGRDPALDVDALRTASALIALGIAAQLIWIMLGAASWDTAAVLLVETSIALLVFAAEPAIDRCRRRFGGQPRLKPVPSRPWLRLAAAAAVLAGWGWIAERVRSGEETRTLLLVQPYGSPFCRALVTNRTQWMERLLPPGLVHDARVAGVIAQVGPESNRPVADAIMPFVRHAWIHGSIARAATLVDFTRLSELSILQLDDARFLASDANALPPLGSIEVLNLNGATLSTKTIEMLVKAMPNLRTLRVNYLTAEDANSMRRAFPGIDIDAAEAPRAKRPAR